MFPGELSLLAVALVAIVALAFGRSVRMGRGPGGVMKGRIDRD